MTALLITKTSRNNHTLYTKRYHNGGSLTNNIINKTKLYALRDGSLIGSHTRSLTAVSVCSTPTKGGKGVPLVCTTHLNIYWQKFKTMPKHCPETRLMFANQTVLSQSEPERIGEIVCARLWLLGLLA